MPEFDETNQAAPREEEPVTGVLPEDEEVDPEETDEEDSEDTDPDEI